MKIFWKILVFCLAGIALIPILVYFGPVRLTTSIQDAYYYITDKTEIVDATVTKVKYNPDPDFDGYNVYIQYEFENQRYDALWKSVSDENEYSIGEHVDVKVFENKPHKTVENLWDYIILIIFHLFMTVIGFIMVYVPLDSEFGARKKYPKQENK